MDVLTFVMLGRPGSGKGTQAKLLAQKLDAKLYTSGDEVRKAAAEDSVLGRKFKRMMERGDLMPYWFTPNLFVGVFRTIREDEAAIFDGFCRRKPEAELFDSVVTFLERPYKVIYLDVPEGEAMTRLSKRFALENRKDDEADSIPRRMQEFNEHTQKAIDHFRSLGRVIDVDGTGTPEAIASRISEAVDAL